MENKPMYSSIISSRAQKEILSSFNFYEERQTGLGDRFLEQLLLKIKNIELNPDLYPNKFKSYRETLINVFPLLIIYRINIRKKIIRIIRLIHLS